MIPPGTVYVGIGVGNRWNHAFMKQAAGQTGGYFTQVNPDEPIQWRTMELLSRLNSPRLVNARVAADRWRSFDPDIGDACRLAADALARLGAVDLAWDYLTSPLAAATEASIAWDERGRDDHRQGQYELAQRAYALAFEANPANAELLWSRAQALLEAGHRDRAQSLLQELVHGSWETKYDWIRRQAEQTLRRK